MDIALPEERLSTTLPLPVCHFSAVAPFALIPAAIGVSPSRVRFEVTELDGDGNETGTSRLMEGGAMLREWADKTRHTAAQ